MFPKLPIDVASSFKVTSFKNSFHSFSLEFFDLEDLMAMIVHEVAHKELRESAQLFLNLSG